MSKVTKLSVVNRLPEYASLGLSESDLRPVEDVHVNVAPNDELLKLVFAPHPITGIPNSALGIILSKDKNPELAKYIQDTLLQVQSSYAAPTTDADMALEGVKSRNETLVEYAERLQKFAAVRD